MNGVVQGGWNFVIAAYSVTALGFLIYGALLIKRYRDERAHAAMQGEDL